MNEYQEDIVYEPSLFGISDYATAKSLQAYPKQGPYDTQQDAYRHMLAASLLARKYGTGTAETLGKMHEWAFSPLKALKMLMGKGEMPHDYKYDLHNNQLGASLGTRVEDQAGLEQLLKAIADRSTVGIQPGRAALPVKK
jgi:hypothetical protein